MPLALACMGLLPVRAASPTHFTGVHASPEMIFLYGETFTINGAPAQPGDEVAVYSASGVLCGAVRVEAAGCYPGAAVYRDDPLTPTLDGALADETLRFRVWDASANREYLQAEVRTPYVEKQTLAGQPYWTTSWDAYRVDLSAIPNDYPPVLHATARSLSETATPATLVGAPVVATDADGDRIRYQITAGNAAGIFALDTDTGQISVADSSGLAARVTPSYELTLQADDGLHTVSAAVTVTVVPRPHFSLARPSAEAIFIYGTRVLICGQPAQLYDEIAVTSASGTRCGSVQIDTAGQYTVTVYHDDPITPALDGALDNEVLTFQVYDFSEDREYAPSARTLFYVEKQTADGAPYWTSNNDIYRVDVDVGVNFGVAESAGASLVSESGTADTFTVVLRTAPPTNVVIAISSPDLGEVTLSPATLTFTPDNWNTAQTVTVTGVDDAFDDGDQVTLVTLAVDDANSDNTFDAVADQTVRVTTTDDDTPPDINVQGIGHDVADGDVTPGASDGTDLGSVPVDRGTAQQTFTIQNAGTMPLTVTASTLSGADAADFALSGIVLPRLVAGGGSTPFTVTFDPTVAGTRTAVVTLTSDDPDDEGTYTFAIRGTGNLRPQVTDRLPAPAATLDGSSAVLDITFSEAVTGVDSTDLALSGSAAAAASVGAPADRGGNTWRFPVSGLINGSLSLTLAPDAGDIADLDGASLDTLNWSYTVALTPLTCTAVDKARAYGVANPALTIAYSGLKDGDTAPAVPPTAACAATPASPVGTYTITLSGGSDPDYTLTLVAGTLTVDKATPRVTTWPSASSIPVGQTLASSTLNGGAASVAGTFAFTTPSTAPEVSTAAQAVTFTPTDAGNYTTVSGSVSVTVTPVTRVATRNGPWNDPATWDGPVPATGQDVRIPAGISVTLNVGSPAIRNLTLAGTLALGANTLTMKGSFANTGTLDPGTGTVVLTGGGAQTLSATAPGTLTFCNLTLNKDPQTATVTATSKLTVTQHLTITEGKLVSASDYTDILIATDGTLVLTSDITVSGNLVIQGAGTLTTAGHGITFDGGVEQNLTLASLTTFANLTVTAGTTLIETATADNASVAGTLSNAGVIRKTQPVAATGAYHFGLAGNSGAGLTIAVTSLTGADPLTAIQMDRHAGNHPQAPGTNTSAIYWTVTPTGSDVIATVILPHAGLTNPQVCRYRNSAWDGARSAFTPTTVTRTGLTAFGDVAVFDNPQLATTTTLASAPNPSTYGASVTFTATVSPAAATGTVTFKDGATTLGTGTLDAGAATFTTAALSAGGHSLTATYSGDAVYAVSTSSVLTQTVNRATTTLALASSATPSGLGVSVTFTATVSANTDSGTVTFKDGATTLGSGTVTAGVATFTTSALTLGSHSLTAEYSGDSTYMGSTSETLTQVVKLAAPAALDSSANPSLVGASVTFTATLSPNTATGTVTFKDGATILSTPTVTAGVATHTTSALTAGSHSLTATYSGDATYAPSTSSVLTQAVNKLTTTLALVSSPTASTVGESVTFTATLSPAAATGMIMFRDGTDILGTVTLTAGVASVTTSALRLGSHSLTAEYGGSATYAVCTSSALTQEVTAASPTLAVIGRFCALREATGLVIQWETVSEVGSLAFNLYREDAGAETLTRVTTKGLSAVGEAQGGVYRVLDAGATPGVSRRYLVEELQAAGSARRYGPFEVMLPVAVGVVSVASLDGPANAVAAPLPAAGPRAADLLLGAWPHAVDPQKTARGADREGELARTAVAAVAVPVARPLPAGSKSLANLTSRLRIQVATAGIKYLPAAAIATGLDSTVAEVRTALLTQQLALSCQGSAIAYVVATNGDGLYFYGRAYSSPYSVGNVYWLQPGIAVAVAPASVGDATGAALGSFSERVHREEDNDSRPDLLAAVDDGLWLWGLLQSDVEAFATRSVDVDLPGLAPAGGLATVTVRLHGGNNTAAEFDHETAVEVNGMRLGSSRWDGMVPHEASFTLDAGRLRSGLNTVLVRAVAPAGGAISRSYLDWVEVTYPRRYAALGNSLVFGVSGGASVAVSGFTSAGILLFDISDPARPALVSGARVSADGGSHTLRFSAAPGASRYAALLPAAAEALSGTRVLPSGLRSTTVAAAHLIIAPPELVTAALALAAYRSAQGLSSRVASLTDVYNEFNEGLPEPGAVTAFLRWAAANWSEPPRYVVLAGDGTTDYRNLKGMNDNLMPPLLAPTAFGLFASDNAFADLTGDDGLPDLAIGRLPVMTAAELTRAIGKIVAYETAAPRSWAFDAVVAADRQDEGGDFTGEGRRLLDGPLNGLTVKRIFLADLSLEQGRELLLKSLRFGACLTSWTGHGGLDRLSRSGVLTTADLTGLANDSRPTVLVAASCLIGRFEIPGYDCLAEGLLLLPSGGAVAVWSPSALSYNDLSGALTQQVYAEIFAGARERLGDAILATLRSYVPPAGGSAADLDPRTVYNLLGDPALQLHRKGQ